MGKKDLVDGTVYLNNSGKGFLRASGDKSYSLPKREMFKVFPGDKVKCIIKASDRAKIIEVTERNTKEVKGILDFQKKKYCLNSVDGSYHLNIIIDSKASKSKKVGDIYSAKIIKQPSLKFKPTARLIDTKSFENPFEEASEMALSGSDIPVDWPKDVISQTNRLDSSFLDSNKSLRRDLRNLSFVTIDGRTAKDFDDAIFASENKNDFKLIVAIADVAEFVKFNSPLDLEAKNRATSVYFNHKNNRIKKFGLTERNHAHQLVEECMILANVCAAELLHKAKIPSLFRSHEKPDPLKISNLKDFLTSRQITNNMNSPKVRENIVSWLKAAENKKNKEIINIQILRSMSLARYDALETSHFALSLDKYTHFTSPIRRYADLVVHRGLKELIKQNLNTSKSSKKFSKSNEFFYSRDLVNEIAEEVSEKDRRAEKSCRKAEKFLRCKCAENYIGKEFNGVMVSAFEFGIFVRLENLNIEGFIHVSKLSKKDFFNFEESTMSMKSARSKRSISIGDNLIVKIQSVESYKGRVNLIMT